MSKQMPVNPKAVSRQEKNFRPKHCRQKGALPYNLYTHDRLSIIHVYTHIIACDAMLVLDLAAHAQPVKNDEVEVGGDVPSGGQTSWAEDPEQSRETNQDEILVYEKH
jgi:hypothetical protein